MPLCFSHLRERKFRYNFAGIMNPLYPCCLKIKCAEDYFLGCQNYVIFVTTLMNESNSINGLLVALKSDELVRAIL